MPTVELADLMVFRGGSVNPVNFADETFDLYSIPAFDRGSSDLVRGAEIGSQKQVVQEGDVLLSKIVPHVRRSWVVGPRRGHRLIASGEWIVFRHAGADPRYLRHVLVGDPFHAQFMATVSGVGGSLLRARPAYVGKIRIPLPPIAEQSRIADILDRAEDLSAKRREALALVDDLTQAIFLDMFADELPTSSIGEICDVQGGLQVTARRASLSMERPYLRVANVYRGRLDLSQIKTIKLTEAELARTRLGKGDVLVVEGHGNPSEIGRAAMWTGEIDECVHQNHLIRVRVDDRVMLPVFATSWLNSVRGRRHLLRAANTTSGLNTISTSDVKATPMPVPPIAAQHEFAYALEERAALANSMHLISGMTTDLFESLQQRAFAGLL